LPASALERRRLVEAWERLHTRTAIVLRTPVGFGKTTLMLQWRRRWLQQGAYVAWLTIDSLDRPPRLAQGLLRAVRVASGLAVFERIASMCAQQPERELEAMTLLLAEVAAFGTETVLMLDEAEQLPGPGARRLLDYLLHNSPPNLHVLIASRLPLAIATGELAGRGALGVLESADLRLTQDESVAILRHRFGDAMDMDQCVRVHEATEGWPIALQLAVATLERDGDLGAAIERLSGNEGDIASYFLECLFATVPDAIVRFLERVSILERFDAGTCAAVTGDADAEQHLQWLLRETPILSAPEHGSWLRLQRMAREILLARFQRLPAAERTSLHERARAWFEQADLFHEAALHALAAGNLRATQENAARALWTLGTQGRMAEARAWLGYIPARMLARDVELRLYAAWVLVSGERNAEALEIAYSVLTDEASTHRTRVIASRVAGGAAICADRLDILASLVRDWPQGEPHHPLYLYALENGQCVLALHAGATAEVRERAATVPADSDSPSVSLAITFSRLLLSLSHWQEGDAIRVEALLRPLLRRRDMESGRRSMLACMLAPVLAAAVRELGQSAAASGILANRLDVIERSGEPDSILVAHRTLAAVALDFGDERRALNVLENLEALATRRRLPRLAMHALADRARLHARQGRTETAARLFSQLEAMGERFEQADLRPLRSHFELALALAGAQLDLAREDWGGAATWIEAAQARCAGGGRMRELLQVRAFRAVLAEARGEPGADAQLREAQSLAELGGLRRLLTDVHPHVARLLGREPPRAWLPPAAAPALPPSPGALLTPKEAQILELLAIGMPNKAIARAAEVSGETVKWHLKNIYGKLSAGSRKHAVDRAKLLGLIPA
jgi:LuxR family maltose regulon positive regulatory protein